MGNQRNTAGRLHLRPLLLPALAAMILATSSAPATPLSLETQTAVGAAVTTPFNSMVGEWDGQKKLWARPDVPVQGSASDATVWLAADRGYLVIDYNWSREQAPQDGLLVLKLA